MNTPIHEILPNGTQIWTLNDKYHREDGPAYIGINGRQEWYRHGECHREDGPAIIYANESQYWYLNSERILSIKEYQSKLNLSDEDMIALILKYDDVK